MVHDPGEGSPAGSIHAGPANGTVARAILADHAGRIWIGNEFGLYCWEKGELRKFREADGFEQAFPLSLAEDASGDVWAGTAKGELRRWRNGRFTSYFPPGFKNSRATNQTDRAGQPGPAGPVLPRGPQP